MNYAKAWSSPSTSRPHRQALGLSPDTRVALYQGRLLWDRGIEQGIEAILEVPGTVLAMLGFGTSQSAERATTPHPYADRVCLLPPVPPTGCSTGRRRPT